MIGNILPVQFIGTQRSGSNLLRVMLNQLPEISAPHPPHILKTFFPLLTSYGDLNEYDNFYLLVSDVCDWVNNNPVPWESTHLNPNEICDLCKTRNLIELFCRIYERKAIEDGAKFWCCKSMESVYYAKDIESSGMRPFYIYLYRDGRDVALSFRKATMGHKHIYCLAKKWVTEQRLSLDLLSDLPDNRFIMVRYEDLISKPREVMVDICAKLKIPFSNSVFDYFKSSESKNTANSGIMWRNVTMPIIENNFNKFKYEFTDEEVLLFERVAGDMLDHLGYKTKFWPNTIGSTFTPQQIEEYEMLDESLKQHALVMADQNEMKRRRAQEGILYKIKSRHKSTV